MPHSGQVLMGLAAARAARRRWLWLSAWQRLLQNRCRNREELNSAPHCSHGRDGGSGSGSALVTAVSSLMALTGLAGAAGKVNGSGGGGTGGGSGLGAAGNSRIYTVPIAAGSSGAPSRATSLSITPRISSAAR